MDVTKLPADQRLQFNMIHAHNTFKVHASVMHMHDWTY
jgi:hypothetical protein